VKKRLASYLGNLLGFLQSNTWIADLFVILLVLVYVLISIQFAHNRESVLDEGAYLYKGFLYTTGKYRIYQDDGPWSNHMPLSFLVPGYVQLIFGPGLLSGRYFSIFLAVLVITGMVVLAKRWANTWWGPLIVLPFLLNPSIIKMYSIATSQVLAACMMVWALVFTLGSDRKKWQIAIGVILAALLGMTRINLLPLVFLLVPYIFWEHGRKAGYLSIFCVLFTLAIVHSIFFPGILKLWAYWLPRELSPFLDSWRLPEGYERIWDPVITGKQRFLSVLYTIRFHFTAIMVVLVCFFLWPKTGGWRSESARRASIFLSVVFAALSLVHLWATLFNNYCVFCLSSYLAFYWMTALLLIMTTFESLTRNPPWYRTAIFILVMLGIFTALGFGAVEDIARPILDIRLPLHLTEFPSFASGFKKMDFILVVNHQVEFSTARLTVSTIFGFLVGFGLFLLTILIWWISRQYAKSTKSGKSKATYGYIAAVSFLAAGLLIAPTRFIGGGRGVYDCEPDTIVTYREAGEHLNQVIEPGAQVYWRGGLSAVPLLYAPDVKIYPPQINAEYSFYLNGDPATLQRFGYWNRELAEDWLDQADYVLVEEQFMEGWLLESMREKDFQEVSATGQVVPCRGSSQIGIYRRNR
jgi:hypothetical protein